MTFAYEPVWRCIYCGDAESKLTREHIVPRGLGGDRILPRASCETCREITRLFELQCLRAMMGNARIALQINTDHPDERPKSLPIEIHLEDGTSKTIKVPSEEYPVLLALPIFPPARILRGLPDNEPPEIQCHMWTHQPDEATKSKIFDKYGACTFPIGDMNILTFSRMLTKIAHGFIVGEKGIDGFFPIGTDLIRGKTSRLNYLVGCSEGQDRAPSNKLIELFYYTHNETGIIVVTLRLFGYLGSPTYHVVVGANKR